MHSLAFHFTSALLEFSKKLAYFIRDPSLFSKHSHWIHFGLIFVDCFFCFSLFCKASLPFCHFLLFYFINIYLYLYFTVIACHVTLISWTSFTLDHFSSPPFPQNSGLKVSIYLKLIFDNIGPLRIHIWMSGQGTRTSGRFLFEYFVIAQKILLCLFIYKYLTKEKKKPKRVLIYEYLWLRPNSSSNFDLKAFKKEGKIKI